jgi:hypothetical protein
MRGFVFGFAGRVGVLFGLCFVGLFGCCGGALGGPVAGAGFVVSLDRVPSMFSVAHNGSGTPDYEVVSVTNAGSVATASGAPVVVGDVLPAGLSASSVEGAEVQQGEGVDRAGGSLVCSVVEVSCSYPGPLAPGDTLRVRVEVVVGGGAVSGEVSTVTASGGGVPSVSASEQTLVGSAAESLAVPFGFERFTDEVNGVNGLPDTQAGDHPFETTVSYWMNSSYASEPVGEIIGAAPYEAGGVDGYGSSVKDAVIDLPAGFIGNPQVVAKCPEYKVGELSGHTCPPASQIGVATVYTRPNGISGEGGATTGECQGGCLTETVPIFNMMPDKGYPAQFSFQIAGRTVALYVNVSQETNYAVRVIARDIPSAANVVGVSTTFFGTPESDPHIDNQLFGTNTTRPQAFLDNPASCSLGALRATITADTWQHPGRWTAGGSPEPGDPDWVGAEHEVYPSLTGCDMLQFNPSLEVTPSTTQADEPTGLLVHVHIPQANQEAPLVTTPALEESKVTLPAGLSISPSAADGLVGCSDAQIALDLPGVGGCPQASQVATVSITTPLLPEALQGELFIGTPGCDPCSSTDAADGNMFRVFLQVAGAGVVVKKEGRIYANPSTGQLTTVFQDTPQLLFSDLVLNFKSGLRAPLATPQSCGTFTTTSDFTPWSSPVTPDSNPVSSFPVSFDGSGAACPSIAPLTPSFSAGTSNPNAGQFSPLTLTFGREDREQDLAGIQVRTPAGLSGILSGVPLCGEPQAGQGTCGEGSRLGSMTVAAGPGAHPFYTQGRIYLTQSYKGAPFGLSIVVPTVAGPFNLGNIVVRATISIDPVTAALTVTSDPFPQIIDGVPLRLRTANVTIDRPGFVFNPTNCTRQAITATITGAQGTPAGVSVPFGVAGCAGLKFAPKFTASTSGKPTRAGGASLDVKLSYPPGPQGSQANIRAVKVDLPKQLPSRLTTLQKACTAAVFDANPANCPAASIVGIVRATTPLLPVTLSGPVYFVSHANESFPDLEVVLQGYGVRVDLTGATFISKKGITSSTFRTVPDVPVSSFELYLPQGKNSALAANGNLCTAKLAMPTAFTAQNGAELHQSTTITPTGCPKPKPKAKAKTKAKTKTRAKAKARKAAGTNTTTSSRRNNQ